jgi:hypothetical protein
MLEHPEELLKGAGRPRPLRPDMRARLEAALMGEPSEARRLPPEVRGRLEEELRPRLGEGWPPKGGGKTVRAQGRLRKWQPLAATAGLAAAVALVAGLLVPGLFRGPRPEARSSAVTYASQKRPEKAAPAQGSLAHGTPSARRPEPGAPVGLAKRAPGTTSVTARAHGARTGHKNTASPLGTFAPRAPKESVGAAPLVSSVSPRHGPERGGNVVTLIGTGLGSAHAVYFGAAKTTSFRMVSPRELEAIAPGHRPGTVYVVVATSTGLSHRLTSDRYTYNP